MMCFLREVYWLSGTELIPLFPYLRAGLLKKGGGGRRRYSPRVTGCWQPTKVLQGFLTLGSTQAWAYRSPDEVSLDRRLKFAIICEFT